ncbi:MAG: sugar transferase [Myxococcales bacterium FL481]|nr:MAG: sugar transferase [Myxococcales bacterium FL481]
MSRQQIRFFREVLLAADVVASAAAFLLSLSVREGLSSARHAPGLFGDFARGLSLGSVGPLQPYALLMLGMVPAWILVFHWNETNDFRCRYREIAGRYARAVGLGVVCLIGISFVAKLEFLSRSFVVLFAVTQLIALVSGRVALMELISVLRRKHVDGHRVLIVGCSERAIEFAQSLRGQIPWNLKVEGYVAMPGEPVNAKAIPVVGELGVLHELLDSRPVDEVVFVVDAGQASEQLTDALLACDERGVDVLMTLPPAFPSNGRMEISSLSGFDYPLLGLRRTPAGGARLAVKRVFDFFFSLVALLVAAPVMLAIVIAIRVESPGPILFRQVRVGRSGRKFTMLKFRSMCIDAEAKLEALKKNNEMDGPVFKMRRDPRITRVGGFIRRTSLDELPQFINILLGDMSIVGPRPPLPAEVAKYKPWHRRRLSVKPGLTGLWQVSGRNEIGFEEWMKLDLRYIDQWSLWLDLKIIARTVPAVLGRSGM